MKTALVLVFLARSLAAHADAKEIETLVKKNVDGLAKFENDEKLGFSESSIVIGERGPIDMTSHDGCVSGAVANTFYGCQQAEISHKLGAVTVSVDDKKGIAWFQAPFVASLKAEDMTSGKTSTTKQDWRFGGVAVRTGKTWEIVAAMYTNTITDKKLLAGTDGKAASGAPALEGDKKVAGVVAGWFSSGFAGAAAKSGTLIASGTSVAEFKTAAAATALAKSWDALKLGATKIDAKLVANGALAFVRAEVKMPRKTKGAVAMTLVAVLVPDGDSWKWVSLQYQPEFKIGG